MAGGLLAVALALAAVLVLLLASRASAWAWMGLALWLCSWGSWAFLRGALGYRLRHALVLVTSLLLFLLLPELALRLVDFRFQSGIQFGHPRPTDFVRFVPDEDLFWRLDSSLPGVHSLGFPGPQFDVPKAPGSYRIAFLGDSCTAQGYPEFVELYLNAEAAPGRKKVECVSLAMTGYSSYQGRILSQLYGESLEPDLAVIFFGWNDHWRAWGSVDSQKRGSLQRGLSGTRLYANSRLLQLGAWLGARLRAQREAPLELARVPADEYQANLLAMVERFEELKVPVLLLTAPSSHERLGVPDFLVEEGFVADEESALRLHAQYNQIVRELASHRELSLVDLELLFAELPDLRKAFRRDGIHFTREGLGLVGRWVADAVSALEP